MRCRLCSTIVPRTRWEVQVQGYRLAGIKLIDRLPMYSSFGVFFAKGQKMPYRQPPRSSTLAYPYKILVCENSANLQNIIFYNNDLLGDFII